VIFRIIVESLLRRDVLAGGSFSSGQESLDYLFFYAIPPLQSPFELTYILQ